MAKKKKPSGKRKKFGIPPPKCKAILLCDAVILDAMTGKTSLIGIFENFMVRSLPGKSVPANLFLQLTDGHGKIDLRIEVHDLQADAIIARAEGPGVGFQDRLQKINVWIGLPPMPIESEGVYDIVVYAGDSEIDRQQFRALLRVPSKEDEDQDEA